MQITEKRINKRLLVFRVLFCDILEKNSLNFLSFKNKFKKITVYIYYIDEILKNTFFKITKKYE